MNQRYFHVRSLIAVVLLTIAFESAQASNGDAPLSLGGVAWAKATYALSDESMRIPDLDLYRLQLWGTSELGAHWKGHFRLHASTAPGVLSSYHRPGSIFVYQAYLERAAIFTSGDKLTLGMATNAFLRKLYRLHGTRFIARVLSQRLGYVSPTPLGIRYEYSSDTLVAAVTAEQTAIRPESPSSHLIGLATSVHWTLGPDWTLSSHYTYRHKKTAAEALPSEQVFATSLTYQNPDLVVSAETAGRLRDSSESELELGGGVLAHLRLYQDLHVFGQIMSGNSGFQESLGSSLTWRVGPLLKLKDALKVALIFDANHGATDYFVVSLAAVKVF